jgi:uncharacterized repeat protein (TIGR03803 family)
MFNACVRLLALLLTLVTPASAGKKGQVLYIFSDQNIDGFPRGNVVFDSSGNMYGNSAGFCAFGLYCGQIWELTPTGDGQWQKIGLHDFGSVDGGVDGSNPIDGLTYGANGNLYGTAAYGGDLGCEGAPPVGCGTVYELLPKGNGQWKFTVIYIFQGDHFSGIYGRHPTAGVILDKAGNVYGTTNEGGPPKYCTNEGEGCGLVFKLTSRSDGGLWKETILHRFVGGMDGANPSSKLIFDAAGNLYGTTGYGGSSQPCGYFIGCGVVFKLTPTSTQEWEETVLYRFSGADGAQPCCGLIFDAAGNLYGTTASGGAYGMGTVFELDSGGNETVLHSFNGNDGADPEAGLLFDSAGNLYGTTFGGGTDTECPGGCGVVFKLMPTVDGWKEQSFSFTVSNGAGPLGGLTFGSDHNLYGSTEYGGKTLGQDGVVYEIFRPTLVESSSR